MKLLIENGAEVDVKDDYKGTPLAKAAQIGEFWLSVIIFKCSI